MPSVTLSGRAFLRISGKDAETFLQNLITTNLPDLREDEIRPGALLAPQGKILFDFLICRDGADAFLIETTENQRDGLLKRLSTLGPLVLEAPDVEPVRVQLRRLVRDLEHHRQRLNDLVYDMVSLELGGEQ